jgi:cell division protein FtsB
MDNLGRRVETLEQLPERVTALESQIVQLRGEMRSEFSETRDMIREGDEETRRHMRLLHEDLVGRIATLREGL